MSKATLERRIKALEQARRSRMAPTVLEIQLVWHDQAEVEPPEVSSTIFVLKYPNGFNQIIEKEILDHE